MLKSFTLITTVWGESHTKLFLDLGLPSLMAPCNLPKLAKLTSVKYIIYTRPDEAKLIADSDIYKLLSKVVNVVFVVFKEQIINNHITMTEYHKEGFAAAIRDKSYAVFIPPDCIWSNNSMSSMYDIVYRGNKIIHMSGIRIIKEVFCKTIHTSPGEIIDMPARELVARGLKYLHPISNSHFYREKGSKLMPANLFWTVDASGIIARNFHLHPLLVDGVGKQFNFKSTIDDDLALGFNAKKNEEYVVTDSDELLAFEISSLSHDVLAAYNKGNIDDIALWAETGTNNKHREFIKKTIKIHSGEIGGRNWKLIENESSKVVAQILEILNPPKDKLITVAKLKRLKHRFGLHGVYLKLYSGKYSKDAMRFISKVLSFNAQMVQKLFVSGETVYPWYWNSQYHYEVIPAINSNFKKLRGNTLVFDEKIIPLRAKLVKLLKESRIKSLDFRDFNVINDNFPSFSDIYFHHYDNIVVMDSDLALLPNFNEVINVLAKPRSKIYIYSKQGCSNDQALSLNSNLSLEKEYHFGRLGTKWVLQAYVWYRNKIFDRYKIFRYSMVANSLRLMISPIILLISPIVAIFAKVINSISDQQRHYAVKELVYSKR